jgi:alcohol dehydrogenase class IV
MEIINNNNQTIYLGDDSITALSQLLSAQKLVFIVHGGTYQKSDLKRTIDSLPIETFCFSGFSSNPKYEEVKEGVCHFKQKKYDCILSVGGGSAIDTAKNILLFTSQENDQFNESVFHIAIPTTAGTGSESNCNSVMYKNGVKQSISNEFILPEYAFLLPALISSLPEYQKKSTFSDAFCQCIESIWAVDSNDESVEYASKGLTLLIENMDLYFSGDKQVYEKILLGANYSGRAINISKTTAAHAMSYKPSSLYGIAHGHSVSIFLPLIFDYVIDNIDSARNDSVNSPELWLRSRLDIISSIINHGDSDYYYTSELIKQILYKMMNYKTVKCNSEYELKELVSSVNPERLNNNPVQLDKQTIEFIYRQALI